MRLGVLVCSSDCVDSYFLLYFVAQRLYNGKIQTTIVLYSGICKALAYVFFALMYSLSIIDNKNEDVEDTSFF